MLKSLHHQSHLLLAPITFMRLEPRGTPRLDVRGANGIREEMQSGVSTRGAISRIRSTLEIVHGRIYRRWGGVKEPRQGAIGAIKTSRFVTSPRVARSLQTRSILSPVISRKIGRKKRAGKNNRKEKKAEKIQE